MLGTMLWFRVATDQHKAGLGVEPIIGECVIPNRFSRIETDINNCYNNIDKYHDKRRL